MSNKVQLIKEWVENLKNESPTIPDLGTNALAGFQLACDDIIAFINSIPEEPKKQPKYKSGDTIKGPCNNIFQVKEVLDRQYVLHSENGDELNSIEIVDESSCILEEPASEDLEEEITKFYKSRNDLMMTRKQFGELIHHFTEWQRNHVMKDAVDATILDVDAQTIEFGLWPEKLLDIKEGDKVKLIICKNE